VCGWSGRDGDFCDSVQTTLECSSGTFMNNTKGHTSHQSSPLACSLVQGGHPPVPHLSCPPHESFFVITPWPSSSSSHSPLGTGAATAHKKEKVLLSASSAAVALWTATCVLLTLTTCGSASKPTRHLGAECWRQTFTIACARVCAGRGVNQLE
jgi:hypothetical protein